MRSKLATAILLAVICGDGSTRVLAAQGPKHTHAQPPRTEKLGVRDDCLRCLLDAYDRLPKDDPRRDEVLRQMERLMLAGPSPLDPLPRRDDAPSIIDIPTTWPGWTIQEIPTDTSAEIVLCGTLYVSSPVAPVAVVRLGPITVAVVDRREQPNGSDPGSPPN